jgi:type IV pilus assembly protein PilM
VCFVLVGFCSSGRTGNILDFKRLFYGSRDVFGLDVGSTYIKAVQLRQDKQGYSVVAAGRTKIAGGSGDRVKTNNIVKAIRECIKSAQIKTRYAVCGISGPNVALRRFEFPAVETEEIEGVVLSEAQQACPFEDGQYIVDYQLFKNNTVGALAEPGGYREGGPIRGVLAAATMDIIGHKSQVVKAASLDCVLIDVDGLALLNCFLESEKREHNEPTGILCVGSKITNFAVLGKDGVPFVRDIPHAADEIVADVAEQGNLSLQGVRDIMRDGPAKEMVRIEAGMKTACGRLTGDVAQTLRYYKAQEGLAVRRIYVCGGFAGVKGFVELLSSQLPAEAVLWNPFDRMRFDDSVRSAEMFKEHGSGLALAAGLAMRTI